MISKDREKVRKIELRASTFNTTKSSDIIDDDDDDDDDACLRDNGKYSQNLTNQDEAKIVESIFFHLI